MRRLDGLFIPASRALPWGRRMGLDDPPPLLPLVAAGMTWPRGGRLASTFRRRLGGMLLPSSSLVVVGLARLAFFIPFLCVYIGVFL